MISKVAGQETPFQDVLEGTKTLPGTVFRCNSSSSGRDCSTA
ncbi:MAG: hypothetical protein WCP46_01950 [Alphaproteobacteria bacterium]